MIFVDSNIPMYLVGKSHPNKERSRQLLDSIIVNGDRLVADVEVFQEILHRYVAIDRKDAIPPTFDLLKSILDETFPIEMIDLERAKEIVLGPTSVSARDSLHVAVMERQGISQVLSFDTGFDQFPGLTRIH